jgi:hypothetical protein
MPAASHNPELVVAFEPMWRANEVQELFMREGNLRIAGMLRSTAVVEKLGFNRVAMCL